MTKESAKKIYLNALQNCVLSAPKSYAYPVSECAQVAERMFVAFDKGTANLDSPACKVLCAALGIKNTRKEFFPCWQSLV